MNVMEGEGLKQIENKESERCKYEKHWHTRAKHECDVHNSHDSGVFELHKIE